MSKKIRKFQRKHLVKSEEGPPRLLRGIKDILPEEQQYWSFVLEKFEKLAQNYGFEKIDTPILEKASLFERAVGKETDIVEKEMYIFEDQGKERVALRPEITASICRAYIEHGMLNLSQPVKLYSFGPVFRYNRPQAGRYRQFYQFDLEVLGSKEPVIDAQIILFSNFFLHELGLKTSIQINSIGCQICRKDYRKALLDFYRNKKTLLCSDCQQRLNKNPLRVLDCKEENCQRLSYKAPQIVDFLCEDCKNHFIKVLEYLDELEISYDLNSRLVRGLDYYEKTVFEIWPLPPYQRGLGGCPPPYQRAQQPPFIPPLLRRGGGCLPLEPEIEFREEAPSSQISLGGGGRLDRLIEILGARETPACGVAFGIERIILEMRKRGLLIPQKKGSDIFLAQLGESAKKRALLLFENLRKNKIKVAENLSKDSLKSQLEAANKLGAKFCLILGQKEILDNTVLIRDMESGGQETVKFDNIVKEAKKRLRRNI